MNKKVTMFDVQMISLFVSHMDGHWVTESGVVFEQVPEYILVDSVQFQFEESEDSGNDNREFLWHFLKA